VIRSAATSVAHFPVYVDRHCPDSSDAGAAVGSDRVPVASLPLDSGWSITQPTNEDRVFRADASPVDIARTEDGT
jgi:hypothetical protein